MFNQKRWKEVGEKLASLELQLHIIKRSVDDNATLINFTKDLLIREMNVDRNVFNSLIERVDALANQAVSISNTDRTAIVGTLEELKQYIEETHKKQALLMHNKFAEFKVPSPLVIEAAPVSASESLVEKPTIDEKPAETPKPAFNSVMTKDHANHLIADALISNSFPNNTAIAKYLFENNPNTYTENTWKSYVARFKKEVAASEVLTGNVREGVKPSVTKGAQLTEVGVELSNKRIERYRGKRSGFFQVIANQSSVDKKHYYIYTNGQVSKASIQYTNVVGNQPDIMDQVNELINNQLVLNQKQFLDLTVVIGEADFISEMEYTELALFFDELRELGHRITVHLANNVKPAYGILQGISSIKQS